LLCNVDVLLLCSALGYGGRDQMQVGRSRRLLVSCGLEHARAHTTPMVCPDHVNTQARIRYTHGDIYADIIDAHTYMYFQHTHIHAHAHPFAPNT
jgi:hypothetical protein